MLHYIMQGNESKKFSDLFTLYKQISKLNEEKSGSKSLDSESMASDLARAGSMAMDYQHLVAAYQQQHQLDEQAALQSQESLMLLNLQRRTVQQFQEHLKMQLQKQNEQQQSNEKFNRSFDEHHHRKELAQAVFNKDKSSANASREVKQHLQKFVIERQKEKQLDNVIDRNRPYQWNPALNVNGLHEIAAPYPHFFDKRNSFPLRKTASEPNLKVPSKLKQKVTLDRRNSPLVTKNSAEVRSELANKLKRKINSAEQDAVNSAPSSGPSSPLNNSHGERMSINNEVERSDFHMPVRMVGPLTSGRDLYTSPSLPNLALGLTQSNAATQKNRLGQPGMVMYGEADLQRLAVTRTASLPAPFMQAGLPGFHFPGFTESLAVKMFQQQQMLAEMSAKAEASPGPMRHTPVSRPHKVLSRTHSAPTSTAQLNLQLHRKRSEYLKQQKLQQQQHKQQAPHGMGDYYQRLPTHKEATPTENSKPRSRVHLAASPPPTHPSAITSTTAAALVSHLRHSKMHGSFPLLAQKPKRPNSPPSMDHSPIDMSRSVIVSAPSSSTEINRRVSSEAEPDKAIKKELTSSMSGLSPLLAQKKLAAMAVNDESKPSRRTMMSGDISLHRPLTRTQSSPAVSFSQKPSLKKYKFTTCLAYDPIMLKHGCACGDPHAEHAGRVKEVWSRLDQCGLVDKCESVEPRKATMEELQLAHTYEHTLRYGASPLARQQTVTSDKFIVLPCGGLGVNNNIDIDTVWNEQDTINAARMAVGLTVDLAMLVAEGHLKNGFAVVRPPGHHAEKDLAMAFCYFNAVAVAARKLQQSMPDKMRRILIVDWDAHHCNGTQNIFYNDPSVLVISIHRYDEGNFFPGTGAPEETGEGPGVGFNVNIGFSGGVEPAIGDAEYLSAFRSIVMPIAEEFKPDFVFISAGFSASEGHPSTLGGYKVTPECFSYLTHSLSKLAGGKLVMALEGGFEITPLCDCVEACVTTLLTDANKDDGVSLLPKSSVESVPCETSNRSLNRISRIQERYWSGIKRSSSFLRISHMIWMRELQEDRTINAMASLSVEHGSSIKHNQNNVNKESKPSHVIYTPSSIQEKQTDDDGDSKLVIVTDDVQESDAMSSASSPLDVVGVSSPSPPPSVSPVPSPNRSLVTNQPSKLGISLPNNNVNTTENNEEAMEQENSDKSS